MGEKLRNARVLKHLSQWALTMQTDIPQWKISLIENGYVKPKEEEKRKLARALGVKEQDLFPEETQRV